VTRERIIIACLYLALLLACLVIWRLLDELERVEGAYHQAHFDYAVKLWVLTQEEAPDANAGGLEEFVSE
jgi:hypothetical protein